MGSCLAGHGHCLFQGQLFVVNSCQSQCVRKHGGTPNDAAGTMLHVGTYQWRNTFAFLEPGSCAQHVFGVGADQAVSACWGGAQAGLQDGRAVLRIKMRNEELGKLLCQAQGREFAIYPVTVKMRGVEHGWASR